MTLGFEAIAAGMTALQLIETDVDVRQAIEILKATASIRDNISLRKPEELARASQNYHAKATAYAKIAMKWLHGDEQRKANALLLIKQVLVNDKECSCDRDLFTLFTQDPDDEDAILQALSLAHSSMIKNCAGVEMLFREDGWESKLYCVLQKGYLQRVYKSVQTDIAGLEDRTEIAKQTIRRICSSLQDHSVSEIFLTFYRSVFSTVEKKFGKVAVKIVFDHFLFLRAILPFLINLSSDVENEERHRGAVGMIRVALYNPDQADRGIVESLKKLFEELTKQLAPQVKIP